MHYPKVAQSKNIAATAAHIDILPTLAEICNAALPERKIDGKSLLPLIENTKQDWPERPLFFYWTRRYPELYNNMAIHKGDYKLVGHTDFDAEINDFELFNVKKDPYEQYNILDENTELAVGMKTKMDSIYQELISSENIIHQPLIEIGNPNENPVILNRNDADGQRGIWAQEEVFGKWNVKINKGTYDIRIKFIKPLEAGGTFLLEINGIVNRVSNDEITDVLEMKNIELSDYEGELIPTYFVSGKRIFPFWVELEKQFN